MNAPAPSPAEQAVIDAEALRERVIEALYGVRWPGGEPYLRMARVHVDKLADAVVAAIGNAR